MIRSKLSFSSWCMRVQDQHYTSMGAALNAASRAVKQKVHESWGTQDLDTLRAIYVFLSSPHPPTMTKTDVTKKAKEMFGVPQGTSHPKTFWAFNSAQLSDEKHRAQWQLIENYDVRTERACREAGLTFQDCVAQEHEHIWNREYDALLDVVYSHIGGLMFPAAQLMVFFGERTVLDYMTDAGNLRNIQRCEGRLCIRLAGLGPLGMSPALIHLMRKVTTPLLAHMGMAGVYIKEVQEFERNKAQPPPAEVVEPAPKKSKAPPPMSERLERSQEFLNVALALEALTNSVATMTRLSCDTTLDYETRQSVRSHAKYVYEQQREYFALYRKYSFMYD